MIEKKIILIPDIHGKIFWKNALEFIKSDFPVIFLGDYTDPYISDNISSLEALENFKEILETTKDRKNVELLVGNHDIVYIFPDDIRNRNRTDFNNFPFLQKLYQSNIDRFKLAIQKEGYIISHAGINRGWLDFSKITTRDLINIPLSQILKKVIDNLEVLSCYRDEDWGGEFGSIVWADILEFKDKTNNIEANQIVGHSKRPDPIRIGEVVDIDCDRCFYIDGEGDIRDLISNEVVL